MKKSHVTALIFFAVLLGFLLGRVDTSNFNGSFIYKRGEYSLPNSTIISESSPNGKYTAEIIMDEGSQAYFFAFQKTGGSKLIVDADIAPPGGYHHPGFKLSWNEQNNMVYITVDHDFGDANIEFLFDVKKQILSRVDKTNIRL